jgi:hypothetical protein
MNNMQSDAGEFQEPNTDTPQEPNTQGRPQEPNTKPQEPNTLEDQEPNTKPQEPNTAS